MVVVNGKSEFLKVEVHFYGADKTASFGYFSLTSLLLADLVFVRQLKHAWVEKYVVRDDPILDELKEHRVKLHSILIDCFLACFKFFICEFGFNVFLAVLAFENLVEVLFDFLRHFTLLESFSVIKSKYYNRVLEGLIVNAKMEIYILALFEVINYSKLKNGKLMELN